MHRSADILRLSATDLANHLGCRHLTWLDREAAEGRLDKPIWRDLSLEALKARGLAHERAYVEHLRACGRDVVELREGEGETAHARTRAAMQQGAGAIVQADLRDGRWGGRADVLLRVDAPSSLGAWSYDVVDTKLAQDTRGGTVLQLCLYADLVGAIQGEPAGRMHVVKPGDGFVTETFRFAEYAAFYRRVRARLEEAVGRDAATRPEPVPHCDVCRWWQRCDAQWRCEDHLSLVAGMGTLHARELERCDVRTLQSFAELPKPPADVERGSPQAFARLHGQACIQLRSRRQNAHLFELLPPEPARGLARLPEPSPGDVFFDLEGDPFVPEGGLEYLFGVAFHDGSALRYRAWWASDHRQEKASFEALIDFVTERWRRHPDLHVYHFHVYEPAAVKRLMSRYGTREKEVDELLRGGRFVDLLQVTRQGVRIGVESYSLKHLEPCLGYARAIDLREASAALRRAAFALEVGDPDSIAAADRTAIETYNRDDCLATAALRDWLEARRAELAERHELARPVPGDGDASERVQERAAAVQAVFDALVAGVPDDPNDRNAGHRARWLLAHLLDYFRREDKCACWELFRLRDLSDEELLDERKAVAGLSFAGTIEGGTANCPIHRYRFPPQEVGLDDDDKLIVPGEGPLGTVHAVDLGARTLDIRKRKDAARLHPTSVVVEERIEIATLEASLLAFAREVAASGVRFRAARGLLERQPPRLRSGGPLRRPGEDVVDAAIRVARDLDCSVLPIQGPPGSGKTHTGARMIAALIADGRTVGVTAVSHKVIRNLLDKALAIAAQEGIRLQAAHKPGKRPEPERAGLEHVDNDGAFDAARAGKVVGGTAWLWARDEAVEILDYLFVDEAGQMSLAMVLAAARAARNLVLLGDPQQLEQPQQGAHPEGSEVAALVHVLGGRATMPAEHGLFLEQTWRLHPAVCAFTSAIYYEDRLHPRAGLERQEVCGSRFAGSGLFFVPVAHEGNQSSAPEEVAAIDEIVAALTVDGVTWIDQHGVAQPLTLAHILIVAPYNAQVAALRARLPGARVGTVDKFQGQEAAVVIYSMTSSSPHDAPRGMEFLYNPNRLNVATSRARCACILVASPRLLEPECRTPEQMRQANGLCAFVERAERR
jgi:uncharacterized protein